MLALRRPARAAPRRRRRSGPRRPPGRPGRAGAGAVAARPACAPAATTRPRSSPCGPPRLLRAGGYGPPWPRRCCDCGRACVDQAGLGAEERRAPTSPARCAARPGPAPAGGPAAAGPRRGLRRRADHRCHRARGAARARGRRASESSRSRWSPPPAGVPTATGSLRGTAFRRNQARTNVCAWSPSGSVVASVGTPRSDRRKRSGRQADASRRRNGPRKARPRVRASRSRCGLVVSPASPPSPDAPSRREKASSGRQAASASAGECGVEDQVGRTDSIRTTALEAPG